VFMKGGKDPEKMKIGGGLALLIFGLMIGGPLWSILSTFNNIEEAIQKYPRLIQLPAWGTYKFTCWAIVLGAATLHISAGYRLWKIHTPASVRFALIALWVAGPGTVLLDILATSAIFKTSLDFSTLGPDFFRTLIYTAAWTAYLIVSKRAKNVYNSDRLQFATGE